MADVKLRKKFDIRLWTGSGEMPVNNYVESSIVLLPTMSSAMRSGLLGAVFCFYVIRIRSPHVSGARCIVPHGFF